MMNRGGNAGCGVMASWADGLAGGASGPAPQLRLTAESRAQGHGGRVLAAATICDAPLWIGGAPGNDWVMPAGPGLRLAPCHCVICPCDGAFILVSFTPGGVRINDRHAPIATGCAHVIADGDVAHLGALSLHAHVTGPAPQPGRQAAPRHRQSPLEPGAVLWPPEWAAPLTPQASTAPLWDAASATEVAWAAPRPPAVAWGPLHGVTPPLFAAGAMSTPGGPATAPCAAGPREPVASTGAITANAASIGATDPLAAAGLVLTQLAAALLPSAGQETVRAALAHLDPGDPAGATLRIEAVRDLLLPSLQAAASTPSEGVSAAETGLMPGGVT